MKKNTLIGIVSLLILYLGVFLTQSKNFHPVFPTKINPSPSPTHAPLKQDEAFVTRVVDGDTIEIEGGQKVRYIGIDTPETKHPRKPVQCFGHEAYEQNKKLVEGHVIRLERDVSETDRFGRLLRYVYLPQGVKETTTSALMINDYLVRQGFAHAATFPPDVKYAEQFRQAATEAREAGRGLWKVCSNY